VSTLTKVAGDEALGLRGQGSLRFCNLILTASSPGTAGSRRPGSLSSDDRPDPGIDPTAGGRHSSTWRLDAAGPLRRRRNRRPRPVGTARVDRLKHGT
jgi:hypothetical protein